MLALTEGVDEEGVSEVVLLILLQLKLARTVLCPLARAVGEEEVSYSPKFEHQAGAIR